jgi:hypothetical protein
VDQVLELFSGPAFLPWNRMGNLRSWMVSAVLCCAVMCCDVMCCAVMCCDVL